jgi:hypothetical protein
LREGEPEEKDDLKGVPEGEPVEQKVSKVFSGLDKSKYGPVGKPLFVVSRSGGLDGLERGISYKR